MCSELKRFLKTGATGRSEKLELFFLPLGDTICYLQKVWYSCGGDAGDRGLCWCGNMQQPLTEHSTQKLGTILQHLEDVMGE